MARREVRSDRDRHLETSDYDNKPVADAGVGVTFFYDYANLDEEDCYLLQSMVVDIRRRLRLVMEDVVGIGRQLNLAKEILPHGKFEAWGKAEFGMSEGSLREYRYIADRFGGRPEVWELLTPTTARQLAGPKVSDELVAAVLERSRQLARPAHVGEVRALRLQLAARDLLEMAGEDEEAEEEALDGQVAVILQSSLWHKVRDAARGRVLEAYLLLGEIDQLMVAISEGMVREAPPLYAPPELVVSNGYAGTASPQSIDEWLDLMPEGNDLEATIKVLRLAREQLRLLLRHSEASNQVYNIMPLLEKLIDTLARKMGNA